MEKGAIVGSIDMAQVVLYAFWIFFIGLIFYLRREDKREGYPLLADNAGTIQGFGYPLPPDPKTFLMPHGPNVSVPDGKIDAPVTKAVPTARWPGAPLEPTGNPMIDAVGPASYANRADVPDLTVDGADKIVPMRIATTFSIARQDPDPRGMPVIGADHNKAGTVREVWVDRSEIMIRYLEVDLVDGGSVMLPWNFCRVERYMRRILVKSILSSQFKDVPKLASPDRITLLEEDKVCAYYGGGHLYALPSRSEPLI
ncbi:MAG: photosynthetic reaction center subunit H [Pseudolabrys sp.]|nr:photosynthetic reaction center subunit H [Pseudolabrys sp.]